MRKRTEAASASVVASVVTFLGVRILTAPPSTRPGLHGCGEHGGLVVAGGTDVSAGGQRRVLIQNWHGPGGERASLVEVGAAAGGRRGRRAAAGGAGGGAGDGRGRGAPGGAE